MEENYKQRIQDDEMLSKLFVEKEVGLLTNFSKKNYDYKFKSDIKDLYVETFKEIYSNYISAGKDGKITALLRSVDHLSVPESKSLIFKELIPKLETSIDNLEVIKDSLHSEKAMTSNSEKLDNAINPVVIGILNIFEDQEEIKPYKDKIIASCLDICDDVSQAKPAKETYKYVTYNMVINNIEKIKDFGSFKSRFESHSKKIDKTRKGIDTRYYFGVAAVVIFIIIRAMARLS